MEDFKNSYLSKLKNGKNLNEIVFLRKFFM
jgi:hypothetical protein